jgi:hypothetical protein
VFLWLEIPGKNQKNDCFDLGQGNMFSIVDNGDKTKVREGVVVIMPKQHQ